MKIGDQFVYTAPSGREFVYTVDGLDVTTPQGQRLPRARRESDGFQIYISDELLAQDWWRPVERVS